MQPYKASYSTYNAVDSVLVLLAALWSATAVCINIAELKDRKWVKFFASLSYIVGMLPLFYIVFITLHWMCSQKELGRRMIGRVQGWIGESRKHVGTAGSEESLPDRLINPDEYEEDPTNPVNV